MAIGRRPNTEGIGLEATGAEFERGFIVTGPDQQTAEVGIYAAGDVTGGLLLAHKGSREGIIAAEAIAGNHPRPLDANLVPRTTYCSPQIASMGLSEDGAREAGYAVRVGTFPLGANGRAVIWGERGLCKVVAAEDGALLGVHMIGPEVTELIFSIALGTSVEAGLLDLARAVAPHPTVSEILVEWRRRSQPRGGLCISDHLRFPREHWERIRHTNLLWSGPWRRCAGGPR